ncbi:hypothetical protein C7M84_014800 [Penaeus vannamei]|uniref:Uncharacterized protein n=1 Tax=Penaeus vannamei TaxID=6689 RepID=A0A423SSH0_PENVA|nr:hypothetical protein C7M84_014800 [Penaeus vannamei]
MGWRNGGLVPLLLFLGASIQTEAVFGSSPSKSPLEDEDCIVQRATHEHPVSHAGSRAMLHVDDTAELLVRTFRIKVGGDSLEFRYSGKKPNRSVLYNVSLGDSLGQVSLKLAEWHELEVSPSHLSLGRERLPFPAKVLDTGKGLRFEQAIGKGGARLKYLHKYSVRVSAPKDKDSPITVSGKAVSVCGAIKELEEPVQQDVFRQRVFLPVNILPEDLSVAIGKGGSHAANVQAKLRTKSREHPEVREWSRGF